MLELRGLTAGYGSVQVLWDAALSVKRAEVVCLVGRNGVGKSTTLKSVVGLADVVSGDIVIGDTAIRKPDTSRVAHLGVGYVAQQREICPDLTVEENLLLSLFGTGKSRNALDKVYEQFPRLRERARQRAGSLSGGERKILAFARIMLLEPSLYLVDEPTEGLMPQAVAEICELIRRLRSSGAAVLLVEQNLDVVRSLSDRIYLMTTGRIEACVEKLDDELTNKYLGV